jgi:hypothetical protein
MIEQAARSSHDASQLATCDASRTAEHDASWLAAALQYAS